MHDCPCGVRYGPPRDGHRPEHIKAAANALLERAAKNLLNPQGTDMHYRNGREAKNGDKVVRLEGGKVVAFGVLHSATPGNDYCNGSIAVVQSASEYACMVDCLHVDDVAELLSTSGLDKRPEGK